jgi:hypothetical protein
MFNHSLLTRPEFLSVSLFASAIMMFFIEWRNRNQSYALDFNQNLFIQKRWARWSLYLAIIMIIIAWGKFNQTEFIYFAF